MYGGVSFDCIKELNFEGLREGLCNLDKYVCNLYLFGQIVIVVFNKFVSDMDEEMELFCEYCEQLGVGYVINNVFLEGGEGVVDLVNLVVEIIENKLFELLQFIYNDEDSVQQKIEKVVINLYGVSVVIYSILICNKIKLIEEMGIGYYFVCIVKM